MRKYDFWKLRLFFPVIASKEENWKLEFTEGEQGILVFGPVKHDLNNR